MENIKLPKCKLTGTDGNVFAVIGNVAKVLDRAGLRAQASEFKRKAFSAGSYGEVFKIASEYVDVQ